MKSLFKAFSAITLFVVASTMILSEANAKHHNKAHKKHEQKKEKSHEASMEHEKSELQK